MVKKWHVRGEKQCRDLGVIWSFDLESCTLVVSFAILSVTQAEEKVKKAVALAFGIAEYAPVVDFVLPAKTSATQFVTTKVVTVEKILKGQGVDIFDLATVF